MRLIPYALSDVGRKRAHNEDNFLVAENLGLFAVADGMGGHQAGEMASRLAIEKLRDAGPLPRHQRPGFSPAHGYFGLGGVAGEY